MTGQRVDLTPQMLEAQGIEVAEILGPNITLETLSLFPDGSFSIEASSNGANAPHPEQGEHRIDELLRRVGERLAEDWELVDFEITSATLNGRDLPQPERDDI